MGGGYLLVTWHEDGKSTREYVHRLLAKTFIDNPEGHKYVGHKDHDRGNNTLSNIYWTTASGNTKDGVRDGKINYKGRYKNGFYRRGEDVVAKVYVEAIMTEDITGTAKKYGIHRTTVSSWINKRSHIELTDLLDEMMK